MKEVMVNLGHLKLSRLTRDKPKPLSVPSRELLGWVNGSGLGFLT